MKNLNDFMNQIKALNLELRVLQDDITGIIFVVTPNHVKISLLLKEAAGKKQKFSKILGGEYTFSKETNVFEEIRFLAYQERCEYDGKIFNAFFVSPDYEGTFEKASLPKNMIQKAENYWKQQNVKKKEVAKKEVAIDEFEAKKEDLILKLTQYMTHEQGNKMTFCFNVAIEYLKAKDERARRGLYFVGQERMKISTRRSGLFNLGIENELLMDKLQSPENLMLVYEYLVTVMKFENPDFEEPTRGEIFPVPVIPIKAKPQQPSLVLEEASKDITPDTEKVEFLKLDIYGKIETLKKLGVSDSEILDLLMKTELLSHYKNWQEIVDMELEHLLDTDMSKQEIKDFLEVRKCLKKYELI